MTEAGQEWRPPFPLDDELVRRAEEWLESNHDGRGEPEIPKATLIFLPFTRAVALIPGCVIPDPIIARLKHLACEEFVGRVEYGSKKLGRELNDSELSRIMEILRARLRSTMEELNGRHLLLDLSDREKLDVAMAMDIFTVVEATFHNVEKCSSCKSKAIEEAEEEVGTCGKAIDMELAGVGELARAFAKHLDRLCESDGVLLTRLVLLESVPYLDRIRASSLTSIAIDALDGILEKMQKEKLTALAQRAKDEGCMN